MQTDEKAGKITLVHQDDVPPEAVRAISAGLGRFNMAHAGERDYQKLNLILRQGETAVGGIIGHTSRRWLFVEMLWVHESLRGQGWGSRLLSQAEALARARNCVGAYLDTYSFQAPEFYLRHGYTVFGELADFPPPHSRLFLQKRLGDTP